MSQQFKNLEEVKRSVIESIDNYSQDAINIAKTILNNPEPGFREYKTSEVVKSEFEKIGLKYESGIALTGVKAKLTSNKCSNILLIFLLAGNVIVFEKSLLRLSGFLISLIL